MTTYVMLKPTAPGGSLRATLAPGLDTLEGKRIGILSNQKVNADAVLDALVSNIQEKYKIAGVVKRVKRIQSQTAPAELMNDLVTLSDAVIHGVGD